MQHRAPVQRAPDRPQRIGVREAPGTVGQPPFVAREVLHQPGQCVPRDAVVLGQAGQLHPGIEQRGDDLAQPVVPLMGQVVGEDRIGLDIRAGLVEDQRLRPLEVGVLQHEQVVVPAVGGGPQHRMALAHEQPPAGPQQARHHPGPAGDVGQPAQRADPRVHEVEGLRAQDGDRVIHLGFDETDVGAGQFGDPARLRERGVGEVQPGHVGAEAGQRDGVGADVALQVDAAQPADVTQQRQVEPHHIAEEGGVGGEPVHRIAG